MARDPKRALYVSYNGAAEPLVRSQVLPYIRALSAKGIAFTFLSYEKTPAVDGSVERYFAAAGVRWIRRVFHRRPVALAKLYDIVSGNLAVLGVCMRSGAGIVHARGVMGAVISIVPARIAGARFIFDMKSSLAEAYRLSGKIREGGAYHRLIGWLEDACAAWADTVIVETETHRAALARKMTARRRRPRIEVLPCCVETERFAVSAAGADRDRSLDAVSLVFLGSISGWYMLPEMLRFFKALKGAAPGATFLFLSDDPAGRVAATAREEGVAGVETTRVAYTAVPARLAAADFGVLFKWPNERLDSFPIKIGEYLAAGLPVIINAGMGDVESLVTERRVGVVIGSLDESGYADAIDRMRTLLKEGKALRDRCIDTARRSLSAGTAISLYGAIYHV